MEDSQNSWITTLLFEHACKENFEGVIKNMLEDKDLEPKINQNSVNSAIANSDQPQIKPVFMLIYLLRKLHEQNFANSASYTNPTSKSILPVIIDLLISTYQQYNCLSLKKFLTLISELKLLDLLNLIVKNPESSLVVQKLNQHFPRWTSDYRASMEKDFCIENSKVLDKVEESHTQCRRLILKLAVDKAYKKKYMSEQYYSDLNRLTMESKTYIMEIVQALELHAGSSVLEKMVAGVEKGLTDSDDLAVQLLLDYIQPKITDAALLKYLDDLEPTLNSQTEASCLTKCLLPFDTMSEMSEEESDQSLSEYGDSQDVCDSVKSFVDILPSESPLQSLDMPEEDENEDL